VLAILAVTADDPAPIIATTSLGLAVAVNVLCVWLLATWECSARVPVQRASTTEDRRTIIFSPR